ncbi:hypothetical protein K502DRAFT_171495 [Neoconidiobolus thromboides FSU 785]|nr:hypothetical protein K502DRAFT_171495 [Neoconidiobolus thromboides FSU 785]
MSSVLDNSFEVDQEIELELKENHSETDSAENGENKPVIEIDEEKLKRYSYLLGKSELFSSFIDFNKFPGLKEKVYQNIAAKKEIDDVRHRKTEAEEDAEILKEVDNEDLQVASFTESPPYIKGTLRDYQIHGLNWMISLYENKLNGILADEMGLGKTLQVISLLGYIRHYRDIYGPHLVVVPKTTLHNWLSEFKKWCPEINAFIFHGLKDDRPKLVNEILKPQKFDVCITSYEMCSLEKSSLSKIPWEYLVIDEAHRIKNENSLLAKIIRIFQCKQRLLVTGTPLQNNLHELWALLNFLLPDVFSDADQFQNWFKNQESDQDSVK